MRRIFAIAIVLAVLALNISGMIGPVSAVAESAAVSANITGKCSFIVSAGSASAVHDGTTKERWEPEGGVGEAYVKLPDTGAVCFELQWTYAPLNFTITQYDADKNVISARTQADDDHAYLTQLYDLDPNTRYIGVAFDQEDQGIAEFRIFGEGTLPKTAKRWEKPLDKCDLMVISTHYDDEWLWFGAIIPYYSLVQKKGTQVVYMANCGRRRSQEVLNGLAVSGISNYPAFVRLKDENLGSLERSLEDWGGEYNLIGMMVEYIRRFQPEVILTHDWNGEYGHDQHKLTARYITKAAIAAADPAQYPESVSKYGAWETKKVYLHLAKDQMIQFDWHIKYDEFNGMNGIELATACMNEHKSQLGAYQVTDGGKYDNSLFGLVYSTVGDDVEHKDLFENIGPAVTEAPIAESEPEETIDPEIETAIFDALNEVDSDESETEYPPEKESSGGSALVWILIGVVVIAGAGFVLYRRKIMRARRRRSARPGANRRPVPRPSGNRPNGAGRAGSNAAVRRRNIQRK